MRKTERPKGTSLPKELEELRAEKATFYQQLKDVREAGRQETDHWVRTSKMWETRMATLLRILTDLNKQGIVISVESAYVTSKNQLEAFNGAKN